MVDQAKYNKKMRMKYVGGDMYSDKVDILFSIVLLPLSSALIGYGFYLISKDILFGLATSFFGAVLFGISCMGLNRIQKTYQLRKNML